jgi:hypothetical protein
MMKWLTRPNTSDAAIVTPIIRAPATAFFHIQAIPTAVREYRAQLVFERARVRDKRELARFGTGEVASGLADL